MNRTPWAHEDLMMALEQAGDPSMAIREGVKLLQLTNGRTWREQ
jgi:hypothetical protein